MKQSVFILSDSTGIAAEKIASSLLAQFPSVDFAIETIPYIDTIEKAREIVKRIAATQHLNGKQALVFSTLIDENIRAEITNSQAHFMDFFDIFIAPLEQQLQTSAAYTTGGLHGLRDDNYQYYKTRIDAINYTLNCDDGLNHKYYQQADVIIIGPSRSGKTPTCLYLALQFGIFAANYPITEEDNFDYLKLPENLRCFRHKLFGLSIDAERLHVIRQERKANSQYASYAQCQREINACEQLYQQQKIPMLSSTDHSIEELSTQILARLSLKRRLR